MYWGHLTGLLQVKNGKLYLDGGGNGMFICLFFEIIKKKKERPILTATLAASKQAACANIGNKH